MNAELINEILSMDRGELDHVVSLVNQRRRTLSAMRAAQIAAGDQVRIGDSIRPMYLRGETGTVQSLAYGKAKVKMDHPSSCGRYVDGSGVLTAPAGALEVIA